MLKAICGVVLCAGVAFNAAQAAFIDYGAYSSDTRTGLDWLDTTQTAGLSYDAVKAGAGGWVNTGWRYATGGEVRDLFQFYVGTGPGLFYPANMQVAWSLVLQMGVNLSFNNSLGVWQYYASNYAEQISVVAFFDDGTSNPTVGLGELVARLPSTTSLQAGVGSRWVAYDDFAASNAVTTDGYGSFLVRQSNPVPEPSSVLLTLIAGLNLAVAVRGHGTTGRPAA